MKATLSLLAFILIGTITALYYTYTQHFNQDSKDTATSGIFFKTTLNLKEYKNVSTANNLWGTYNVYSRSDRHDEVLKVYCNQYCK